MIIFPITHLQFKDPYVGTDKVCYEKTAISKWLTKKHQSPYSREPMQMHCLNQDHTMAKIIRLFQDLHITDEVIKNLNCAHEDAVTKPDINLKAAEDVSMNNDLPSSSGKRKRKKTKQRNNRVCKDAALKGLKWHKRILMENNFYLPENLLESMPKIPSYSIMHSLKEGFSILMYSGSHRVKLSPSLCLHHCNAVRIILPECMMIIWHESLYHAGCKSRDGLEDMRFFAYVWAEYLFERGQRTKGTTDGVARENGD